MARQKTYSNVIAFDDEPFAKQHRGRIRIVGTVYAGLRFDGVVIGDVQRDGDDAAEQLATLVTRSKFEQHIQLIMLQGIALGGFNVVDVFELSEVVGVPVLVVCRHLPDMDAIRHVLLNKIPNGAYKWDIVQRLGPMEPAHNVFVQRVGLSLQQAEETVQTFAVHSNIPEPIRASHLIAGAIATGQSRGQP